MKHWRLTEILESKQQASPVSEVADAGVDVIERKPQTPTAVAEAAVQEEVAGA